MKKISKICGLVFILFLSISLNSCNKNEEDLGEKTQSRTLEFYALNDFHGKFLYNESYKEPGISKIGKFVQEKRKKDPENTFLISSGDMFQGGPESNITYGQIVVDAMNALEFDAMTLGNHEFDWGEEVISELSSNMNFPLLANNVFYKETSKRPDWIKPYTIVQKEGIKVGIIGSIMPGIETSIISTISSNFLYKQNIEEIKNNAKELRNQNCDIVVLSVHDGEAERYRELVGVVDAIFLGHEHDRIEGYLTTTTTKLPYIEGGCDGKYLSNISLELKLENNHYKVVSSSYKNLATFNSTLFQNESKEVNAVYEKYEDSISPIRDEILYTFVSYTDKAKFGRYLAYALRDYASSTKNIDCISGVVNSGGIRSNIQPGKFTFGDLIRIYPFENKLSLLGFTKESYKSFMAGQQIKNSAETEITHNGLYYVATIDYVAYGNYANIASERIDSDVYARDILKTSLKETGFIEFNK